MAYVVCAKWIAKEGEEDAVAKAVAGLVGPSRAEPGILLYQPHRDPEDPKVFFFYEQYQDADAYQAHVDSDALQGARLRRRDPAARGARAHVLRDLGAVGRPQSGDTGPSGPRYHRADGRTAGTGGRDAGPPARARAAQRGVLPRGQPGHPARGRARARRRADRVPVRVREPDVRRPPAAGAARVAQRPRERPHVRRRARARAARRRAHRAPRGALHGGREAGSVSPSPPA